MKTTLMAKVGTGKPVARFFLILLGFLLISAGAAFCGTISALPESAKQVLVIHSYYPTFTWTNNITEGIRRSFHDSGREETIICFEFLDAKRHPETAYLERKAELLRMKYPDPGSIDVIICSDDQALSFLLDRSDTLFEDVPFVFCGVNGYAPRMRKIKPALTGVIEAIDPKSTLEAALRLQPDVREVLIITDITLTGRAIEKTARQAFEPFRERLNFRYVSDMTMAELQTLVSTLASDSIVFLFVFNRDNTGRNFTHERSLKNIADHCGVPIYSFWTFYLGQGIVGGMLTSGDLQGKTAAQLALRILNGEQAQNIPVVQESPNRFMFDYHQLVRHNLSLKKLPAGSAIFNRPESLYEKYQYRIWTAASFFVLQTVIIILLLMNIRKRRHAEKALMASEQKYRTLVETITDIVFVLDAQGRFTLLNPEFESVTGYPVRDFLGRPFTDILSPEFIQSTVENFQRGLAGQATPIHQVAVKHKDGKTVPVELNVTSFIGADGKPTGRLGVARDITERKNTEETLRESEKKFRSFFDLSPQAIALTDVETGEMKDVNNMFCSLTQYSREEIIGKGTTEMGFYAEKDRAMFVQQLGSAGEVHGLKMEYKARDGSILTGLVFARIIQIAGRKLIFSIILDITEQQRLEARLQLAKKMEAIGTLAGGVAHDLNNVLSGIVSCPDLVLAELPETSPLRKFLLLIKEAGERAAAIVNDLLTLARRGVVATEVMNLNQIINSYLKSPEYEKLKEAHPCVTINSNLTDNLLNIIGSPFHLFKTVMNLIANAAEAMPDGGCVVISTRNQYLDKPVSGYDDVQDGDYVVLSVSDSGIGMSSADRERMFEPFYTRKVMGRSGTGLGLAVVWGTVKDHNGYIDVQSENGKGTTLTLYFPVTRKAVAEQKQALPLETYLGNGESVLVVDDVREQREIASIILKKLNYVVTSVASGEEAVDYLKDNSADLLILDMIMDPGIDGLETYKRILAFSPKQKAIIASGFSETERVKAAQRLGAGRYIKKPYTLENIGLAVKEGLQQTSSINPGFII